MFLFSTPFDIQIYAASILAIPDSLDRMPFHWQNVYNTEILLLLRVKYLLNVTVIKII